MRCARCYTKKSLTKHHIIPKRVFRRKNQPIDSSSENIEILCRKCHNLEHIGEGKVSILTKLVNRGYLSKEKFFEVKERYGNPETKKYSISNVSKKKESSA